MAKACEQGQDDRSSDLCAQWKAADSAYEGAIWTKRTGILTFFGLIVGFITMGAAIAAACFAKSASDHTRDAADTAERVAALEVRPWLIIDQFFGGQVGIGTDLTKQSQPFISLTSNLVIKNVGRIPARDVVVRCRMQNIASTTKATDAIEDGERVCYVPLDIVTLDEPRSFFFADGLHPPQYDTANLNTIFGLLVQISYTGVNGVGNYTTRQHCRIAKRLDQGQTVVLDHAPMEDVWQAVEIKSDRVISMT